MRLQRIFNKGRKKMQFRIQKMATEEGSRILELRWRKLMRYLYIGMAFLGICLSDVGGPTKWAMKTDVVRN